MLKIDTEKSITYRYDRLSDLVKSVEKLGKYGYFSDDEKFSEYVYGTLVEVKCCIPTSEYPFVRVVGGNATDFSYRYFIPEDAVAFKEKEEPKKLRPFKDIGDFVSHMCLRDSGEVQFLKFRSKGGARYYLAYNGYEIDTSGDVYIHFGSVAFTLNELFTHYEYELNGLEWLPFGVEE